MTVQQKFYVGPTSISALEKELQSIVPKNVFLLRGKKSYVSCGAKETLDGIFARLGCSVVEWQDFMENPKIEDVQCGLKLLQSVHADAIVAVGGGSVLDMSKLVRFLSSYQGDVFANKFEKVKKLIPLFVVPTTSGTGAEATHFAVCYKDKVKYSVAHPEMLADVAVVYPPFTYGNSAYLTACTGFDALAQGIEAFWSINATAESDTYAAKAIPVLWNTLPLLARGDNTPENRDAVAEASYWAGRAINITKTTAPHAFSYAFTTYCGYPHGHAVALTFPFLAALNMNALETLQPSMDVSLYRRKSEMLMSMLGIDGPDHVLGAFKKFVDFVGLEKRGFGDADLKDLLAKVNVQRLNNNPVQLSESDLKALKNFLEL